MDQTGPLPVRSLNHISRVCKSLSRSLEFYTQVLGFLEVKRPGSLNFEGAWLFNYGVGIHLLKDPAATEFGHTQQKRKIDPQADHLSFQSDDLSEVERRLKLLGLDYVCRTVTEDCIEVQQLFFHDPDGFMIEVCNCENIPVVPLPRCGKPLARRLSKRHMLPAVSCELIDSESPRTRTEANCRVSPSLSSQSMLSGFETPVALQGIAI